MLRAGLMKILHHAGVTPWERLFHKMRATRQTELSDRFPSHVVVKWLGNSEAVAQAHYLQTTDDHFARALEPQLDLPTQKPTQYGTVQNGNGKTAFLDGAQESVENNGKTLGKSDVLREGASGYDLGYCTKTPRLGLEPRT